MEELNNSFENYIEEFKKLSVKDKREEVINSVKEIIAVFDKIARDDNIVLNFLKALEIDDLNKDKVSEDDYLEGLIVYIEAAKNMIGQYLYEKSN